MDKESVAKLLTVYGINIQLILYKLYKIIIYIVYYSNLSIVYFKIVFAINTFIETINNC